MTISSTTRKAGPLPGNGVTTLFPFAFKVFAATDLVVTLTVIATGVESTLVLNDPAGYTVALNADQNANPGGSITYNPSGTPMDALHEVTITSAVPQLQTLSLTNGGGFFPLSISDALDRCVIIAQQISQTISRGLVVSVSDTTPGPLPNAAARANNFLAFDGSGNPIASSGIASAPVSAAMTAVVSAATVAAGRTALGIPVNAVTQADTAFTTAGAGPNFTLTPTPALGAYAANVRYRVKFNAAGAGADQLNISALGNKALKQYNATGTKIAATIAANMLCDIEYDGVDLVLIDPLPQAGIPWAVAAGTDVITAAYAPVNTALTDGLLLSARAAGANATPTPTFSPDGLTAHTITRKGGGALLIGDIPGALAEIILRYNLANTRWELLNPAGGLVITVGTQLVKNPVAFGTATVQAHGLGVEPTFCKVIMECLTAELGYSIGDHPQMSDSFGMSGGGSAGYTLVVDATNVTLVINNSQVIINNKSTGAAAAVTAANWKFIVTPYKVA